MIADPDLHQAHYSTKPTNPERAAIEVVDLKRSFRKRKGWLRSGETVEAVRGVSFSVPRGGIYGVLGPNGAGKTTTIKMLSTLLLPTGGTATINGFDIVRDEHRVRRQLGVLFGGDKGLYNQLNAIENMRYFGRLYGMDDAAIDRRTSLLLERVQLAGRAGERVESYSRGMKQRLHIAKTLIHDPPVVILDEPTIGLDPGAAIGVRELIADLVPGHTVLLTTHDMYEADLLCREIAIIDQGLIVAQGTPAGLKANSGIERGVEITLEGAGPPDLATLEPALVGRRGVNGFGHRLDDNAQSVIILACDEPSAALDAALAALRDMGTGISAVTIREPTLEDVFLQATGREFDPVRIGNAR